MALLEVDNLAKTFRKGKKVIRAVDGVSFSLEPGRCLGLVGESGCGKSTTANIIARLMREDRGTIHFDGRKISGGLLRPVYKDMQMIFQNPQDSFDPRDTVLSGIMQGAASLQLYKRAELEEKAMEMFHFVGLKTAYAKVRMSELSGGECQRAAIARALICEPRLIICDEATSALDVLVQAQIVALLQRLKAEKGVSLLFITHDLPLAAVLCDTLAVMHQGRLIECGPARQLLQAPQHEQTKKLINAVLPVQTRRESRYGNE